MAHLVRWLSSVTTRHAPFATSSHVMRRADCTERSHYRCGAAKPWRMRSSSSMRDCSHFRCSSSHIRRLQQRDDGSPTPSRRNWTMSDDSIRYVRTGAMIPRRVAGETLLVPRAAKSISAQRRGAELFVLNDSGDALWTALETPRSVHDLARNLIETYDISTSQAAADVDVFLQSMLAIGAIAKVNG